jgi:hypothetical protein
MNQEWQIITADGSLRLYLKKDKSYYTDVFRTKDGYGYMVYRDQPTSSIGFVDVSQFKRPYKSLIRAISAAENALMAAPKSYTCQRGSSGSGRTVQMGSS